jgi:hypothetical protein
MICVVSDGRYHGRRVEGALIAQIENQLGKQEKRKTRWMAEKKPFVWICLSCFPAFLISLYVSDSARM